MYDRNAADRSTSPNIVANYDLKLFEDSFHLMLSDAKLLSSDFDLSTLSFTFVISILMLSFCEISSPYSACSFAMESSAF